MTTTTDPVAARMLARTTVHKSPRRVLDSAVLDAFDAYQRRRNFSPKTIYCRRAVFGAFGRHLGGGMLVASRREVEEWLDSVELGPQGRYTYLAHLHAFYRFALREGLASEDPTDTIDRPRLPKRLPRPLASADLARALEMAGSQMRAWLCLGAYQGFRRSDMAGLERADVLDAQEPALVRVTQGKGKKDRVLPAHARTLEALRAYGMPQEGPVFVRDGRAMTPDEVGLRIARFFAEHGIAGTPHSLRHTFGTTVYKRSRDLLLTQRLMGHSSLQTVMGYVALNPDGREVDVVCGLGDE